MKIRKIKFENINSLRGKHEIDFTTNPLKESRLFAITGPTGSGKSTILDVIALALFNQVPRLGKISNTVIEQGGAILTRNTKEAFASVEYECANGVFRSTWSISTNRNDNLNSYGMEIADVALGKNFDLKKSEVPAKNEELIGLSYEQFIKSIMLAQGEFAKFLQVSKGERSALLEKITGTGIYRTLGIKAFEKKGLYAKALGDLRKEEEIYKGRLLDSEALNEGNVKNKKLGDLVDAQEKELKQLESQINLRAEIDKIESNVKHKQEDVKTKEGHLQMFNQENGQKIKNHEAISPCAEKLETWKQNELKIREARVKLDNLKNELVNLKNNRADLLEKVTILLKKPIDPSELKQRVVEFQELVEGIEDQTKTKILEFDSKHEVLVLKGEPFGFNLNADTPMADIKELQDLKEGSEYSLDKLKVALDGLSTENPEEEIERLSTSLQSLKNGKDWSGQIDKIQQTIKEEQDLLQKKTNLENILPAQIKTLKIDRDKRQSNLYALRLELENQKLRASLEEHRSHLKNGSPCLLCGSTEHPYATNYPVVKNELSKTIEEEDTNLKKSIEELSSKEEQLKGIKQDKEVIDSRITGLTDSKGEIGKKLQSECSTWLKDEIVDWEGLMFKTNTQIESLKEFKLLTQKLTGINSCIPLLKQMLEILENIKELKGKKNNLFAGEDIRQTCETLRESWTSLNQELTSKVKQEEEDSKKFDADNNEQRQLRAELDQSLMGMGFDGVEDAISKRLKEGEYHELQRRLNELKNFSNTAKAELQTIQKSLAEKRTGITDEDIEELNEKFGIGKLELTEVRQTWEEIKRRLTNHNETLVDIKSLQQRIAEEEKTGRKWEVLNDLIGDATGRKFNDFAQDLTLQRLLILANNRLSELSDRYQIASPNSEEDDSLVAVDNHMGGQRRSVKTLSGGETFILSLSLALALSDLAAKNVEINSLFIDEGFGTLDPETLDQTIDTLEKLQTESSKTIGIISHVESLKERIGTQIRLERNGQGYSTLNVV